MISLPFYHYCTTSFNKSSTHVLHRLKTCTWPVKGLQWWEQSLRGLRRWSQLEMRSSTVAPKQFIIIIIIIRSSKNKEIFRRMLISLTFVFLANSPRLDKSNFNLHQTQISNGAILFKTKNKDTRITLSLLTTE